MIASKLLNSHSSVRQSLVQFGANLSMWLSANEENTVSIAEHAILMCANYFLGLLKHGPLFSKGLSMA